MVVPAVGFDLDVLAHEVEPGGAHGLDVEHERVVGWRRHEPVGPIRLVEDAFHEERLVVEEDSAAAAPVAVDCHRAERAIALDDVVTIGQAQAVQVGCSG